MKVVCESCESVFKAEVVKGTSRCPVCGASFDDSIHYADEKIDFEHPDMYFYDIDDEEDNDDEDLRDVWCQCTTCRQVNCIPYLNFNIIKPQYVKLKENLGLSCEGCGKPINKVVIPIRPKGWREAGMWGNGSANIPTCPICGSPKISKISLTNKVASVAVFGTLAAGHVSKTFRCGSCGAKF